ncbi:GNAT family N-acetyltransferase [Shimia marina]|uniref:Putative acetyltransferase n=1 Tax=Shimia marina TaxID=321267 RepID=A0A0P1FGC5_9RHOB|nr:GNAT family N-acetyltransferase [Shimia marina]CUH52831.1 putative acetyltransferase [Shimia marina]SFD88515.1 Acetyltransferase (GNAT) family protein [Shimia marina]
MIGAALFSRLRYAKDPRRVFILSPMAIATAYQGRGLGQSLLSQAHQTLGTAGVEIVITYGDPAFYAKTGYQPITTDVAKAPLPLSYPHGWIGQSLTEAPFTPLKGDCRCVAALNDPRIW